MTALSPLTELQALGQAFNGGWRDIASAPKDYTDVLVFSPDDEGSNTSGVTIGWFDVDEACWYSHDIQQPCRINPTRWMPLPAPPAAGLAPLDERGA